MQKIVIIGAGQAGAAMAAKLRALGHDGPLTLVGEEPLLPYQRPPLSKKYLLGELSIERLFLRQSGFYTDQGIEVRTSARATGIDPRARRIVLSDGPALDYDMAAICTGGRPKRLPEALGGTLEGVHVVRNVADVDSLAPRFVAGARALIIGGGYIGLEAAAVAAQRGLSVTLIEAAPRILARVAAPETASAIRALHEANGVVIREGVSLARLTGANGRVVGAELADGSRIEADFAIIGIGIQPNQELAETAGLAVADGISVDARGRTSDPAIWAAGDCTRLPLGGAEIRLESVQNAIDQAEAVAADMLGHGKDYAPVPWFWSDQYDLKLQIAGLGTGADRIVVRATPDATPWHGRSHWYFSGDRLLAVDALGDPRAFMVGKRLLETGRGLDPDIAGDAGADLRAAMA